MPLWLTLLIMALATQRLTRLITRDALPVIAIPREVFVRRWATYDTAPPGIPLNPKVSLTGRPTNLFMRSLAYLAECDWCMAVWVGGILTLITAQITSVPLPVLTWLAVAGVAAIIAERETPPTRD